MHLSMRWLALQMWNLFLQSSSYALVDLIGALLVGGGAIAAVEFMKWMNMEIEFEPELAKASF